MGFLTRCKRLFLFAFLLQFCNMLFSFFLKTFLILFEKQHAGMDGFTQKYFQHIASLDTVCGMFDALRSAQLLSFQASSLSAVA